MVGGVLHSVYRGQKAESSGDSEGFKDSLNDGLRSSSSKLEKPDVFGQKICLGESISNLQAGSSPRIWPRPKGNHP